MTMTITPTTLHKPPNLLRHKVLFRNFVDLRLTLGTVLRVAADIISLWGAFLFCWLVVQSTDSTILATKEFIWLLLVVASFSILAVITYIGRGLYNRMHRYSLATKIRSLSEINIAWFIITAAVLSLLDEPIIIPFGLLLTTFLGSTILQSLARVASSVLRSEEVRPAGEVRNEADENKVLVIGGAGYIGSALVDELLKLGLQVSVLDAMHFGEAHQKPQLVLLADVLAPECSPVLQESRGGSGKVLTH